MVIYRNKFIMASMVHSLELTSWNCEIQNKRAEFLAKTLNSALTIQLYNYNFV